MDLETAVEKTIKDLAIDNTVNLLNKLCVAPGIDGGVKRVLLQMAGDRQLFEFESFGAVVCLKDILEDDPQYLHPAELKGRRLSVPGLMANLPKRVNLPEKDEQGEKEAARLISGLVRAGAIIAFKGENELIEQAVKNAENIFENKALDLVDAVGREQ